MLGALSNPEELKTAFKKEFKLFSCEVIGEKLAQECHENSNKIWAHPLLKHNQSEIARMQDKLAPILFAA